MHVLRNCHRYCTPCHNIQVVRLCIKICQNWSMPLHPDPIVISSGFLSRKWWPTSNHLWISAAGMKALFILQRVHPENHLVDINDKYLWWRRIFSTNTSVYNASSKQQYFKVTNLCRGWIIKISNHDCSLFLLWITVFAGQSWHQTRKRFNSCQNIQPTRFRVSWWVS